MSFINIPPILRQIIEYAFVMPRLKSKNPHVCFYCGESLSRRTVLKTHLTGNKTNSKEPWCGGLNIPLPENLFVSHIVPYYKNDDASMPDIGATYIKAQTTTVNKPCNLTELKQAVNIATLRAARKKICVLQDQVKCLEASVASANVRIVGHIKTIHALRVQVQRQKERLAGGNTRTESDAKKIHALQEKIRWLEVRSPKKRPRPRKSYATISDRQKRRRVINMIDDNVEGSSEETVAKFQKSLETVTPDKDLIWLLKATLKYGADAMREHIENRMATTDQQVMDPDEFTALETQLRLSRHGTELLHRVAAKHGQNGKSIFPTRTARQASRKRIIQKKKKQK